ncbi:hypothetical protein FO519_006077 [Halicephalobus sp. NKZ332]|nr:hypothetical protein FO519_006077 [Halicephalobus sp. NKZ332]
MLSFNEMMKQAAAQEQRSKDEINFLRAKQQETQAQKKKELVQMHKSNLPSKPVKPPVNNNKGPPSLSDVFKNFKIPKKIDPDAPKKANESYPKPSTSKSISNPKTTKPSNRDPGVSAGPSIKKSSVHEKVVDPDKRVTKNAAFNFTPKTEKLKTKEESREQRQKIQKDTSKKTESLKPSSTPAVSCFNDDLLNLLSEAKHVSAAPPPKVPPKRPTLPKPPVATVVPRKVDVSRPSLDMKEKNSAALKGKKPSSEGTVGRKSSSNVPAGNKFSSNATMGRKRFSDNFTERPPHKKPATFEDMMKLASENAKKIQSGEPLVPSTSQTGPTKLDRNNLSMDSRQKPDYRKSSTVDSRKNPSMMSKPQPSRSTVPGKPFPSINDNAKRKESAIPPRKNEVPAQKNPGVKNYDTKHQFTQKKPSQMEVRKNSEPKNISQSFSKSTSRPLPPSSARREYIPNRYPPNPYLARKRNDGYYDDEDNSSLDDFIDDEVEDDRPAASELNKVLRQFCRSDKDTWMRREREINLSTMQSNYRAIEAEDRRSSKIARIEDMLEEQRGARRLQ